VNELEKETTCSGVLQKLRTFPKSLNAIYGRMLLQIEESDRRMQTSLILRWVALAVSPLTLEELAEAIHTQPFTTVDAEPTGDQIVVIGAQQVIRDQIKMCGSLLQIHGETVVLVHKSAREFLLRKEADDSTILEEFRIKPAEAHMLIALTCLECIKRSPLRQRALSPDSSVTWKESPLLRYAVVHWQEHAKLSVDQGVALFNSPSFLFEKNAQIRDNWWQTFEACVGGRGREWGRAITLRRDEEKLGDILRGIELKIQRQLNEKTMPPLHMACRLGLVEWARAILQTTKHQRNLPKVISALDENGLNPLTWAAMEGHVDVVGLLLDYQADINATTSLIKGAGLSLMPSRSLNSYIREVTDGDSIWTGKHTVLYRAAFRGHAGVVSLLLERGAEPNLKGWASLTPLHAAAMAGREEVVRLLLENGASKTVNAKLSVTHITPLQYSAEADNYTIASMLLESGADVHSKQTHSRYTALHCAVAEDAKTQIVQLMVDHGADVMSKTMWMDTPLHLAAELSRSSTIELLVERGAIVENKHSFNGNTALHLAAKSQSRSENIEMLLDLGANIDAKNSACKTPLHLATEAPDASNVRVLLDRGADPNAKSRNGESPLHSATKSGNAMIVQLLLDRASDVNALNNDGQTALDVATSSKVTGSEEVKELLISMGGVSGQDNKVRGMKQVSPSRLSVLSKLNKSFASSTFSSTSAEDQRTNSQNGTASLKKPD
jgi:ankyrin repeat protein